jgi:predicted CoA-binding protein
MNNRSMTSPLAPQKIAVVGASQRGGRGANVIANLRQCGFEREIFGVNPRYQEVAGCPCVPRVADLPPGVDSLVAAVGADSACGVLEEAHGGGIPAAVVLAAGLARADTARRKPRGCKRWQPRACASADRTASASSISRTASPCRSRSRPKRRASSTRVTSVVCASTAQRPPRPLRSWRARGRQHGDVEAPADLLVRLGAFALADAGRFGALDLNPIIVRPPGQGVVAVDIALDPEPTRAAAV